MPSGVVRRSRRTRGERPEIIPPKSDEEPDGDDEGNSTDPNPEKEPAADSNQGKRRKKATTAERTQKQQQKKRRTAAATSARRTRRTRTRGSSREDDKMKSGTESSQNDDDSDSSSDDDNTSRAQSSVDEDQDGKDSGDNGNTDDGRESAENDSRKAENKTSSAAPPPSRRGRPRRVAASAKDETDPETTKKIPSGSDDSTDDQKARRGSRRKRNRDHESTRNKDKDKKRGNVKDEGDSSEDDVSMASSKLQIVDGASSENRTTASSESKKAERRTDNHTGGSGEADHHILKDKEILATKEEGKATARIPQPVPEASQSGTHEPGADSPRSAVTDESKESAAGQRQKDEGSSFPPVEYPKISIAPSVNLRQRKDPEQKNDSVAILGDAPKSDQRISSGAELHSENQLGDKTPTNKNEAAQELDEAGSGFNKDEQAVESDETGSKLDFSGTNGAKRKAETEAPTDPLVAVDADADKLSRKKSKIVHEVGGVSAAVPTGSDDDESTESIPLPTVAGNANVESNVNAEKQMMSEKEEKFLESGQTNAQNAEPRDSVVAAEHDEGNDPEPKSCKELLKSQAESSDNLDSLEHCNTTVKMDSRKDTVSSSIHLASQNGKSRGRSGGEESRTDAVAEKEGPDVMVGQSNSNDISIKDAGETVAEVPVMRAGSPEDAKEKWDKVENKTEAFAEAVEENTEANSGVADENDEIAMKSTYQTEGNALGGDDVSPQQVVGGGQVPDTAMDTEDQPVARQEQALDSVAERGDQVENVDRVSDEAPSNNSDPAHPEDQPPILSSVNDKIVTELTEASVQKGSDTNREKQQIEDEITVAVDSNSLMQKTKANSDSKEAGENNSNLIVPTGNMKTENEAKIIVDTKVEAIVKHVKIEDLKQTKDPSPTEHTSSNSHIPEEGLISVPTPLVVDKKALESQADADTASAFIANHARDDMVTNVLQKKDDQFEETVLNKPGRSENDLQESQEDDMPKSAIEKNTSALAPEIERLEIPGSNSHVETPDKPSSKDEDGVVVKELVPFSKSDTEAQAFSTNEILNEQPEKPDITRYVSDDVDPMSEDAKIIGWKYLSSAKVLRAQESLPSLGLDQSKIKRVKVLLYSAGSQTHRGKGFERKFAEYWDAVCLRLSDRLSSHTLGRCDDAIANFLTSKKIRRIHNKFIMEMMRRATSVYARSSEIVRHVPVKWRNRIKVKTSESSRKRKVRYERSAGRLLEKSFLDISAVPHPIKDDPYREPWPIFDIVKEISEEPKSEAALELLSRRIPGAIVVDPVLRDAATEKGISPSDNAIWLLTIALREYTKNLLKATIASNSAMQCGEINPQLMRYPHILASSGTKDGRLRAEALPRISEGGINNRISVVDIFSVSQALPLGQVGSLGGAISRLSLEYSLQATYPSIPPLLPGKDMKDVKTFVVEQVFDKALNSGSLSPSKSRGNSVLRDSQIDETAATPAASTVKPNQNTLHSMSTIHADPSSNLNSTGISNSSLNSPPPRPNLESLEMNTSALGEKTSESAQSLTASKLNISDQPVVVSERKRQASMAGAGRGAKNLAALMSRATDPTNDNLQSDRASTEKTESPGASAEVGKTDVAKPSSNEPSAPKDGSQRSSEENEQINADVTATPQAEQDREANRSHSTLSSEPQDVEPKNGSDGAGSGDAESTEDNSEAGKGPKGKGFGTKDLAAMRARSATQPEIANDQQES